MVNVPSPQCQPTTETLVDRLRNPMWAHGNMPFESFQLEQEENLAAMVEAADRIEELEAALAAVKVWFDQEGYVPADVDGQKVKFYRVNLGPKIKSIISTVSAALPHVRDLARSEQERGK